MISSPDIKVVAGRPDLRALQRPPSLHARGPPQNVQEHLPTRAHHAGHLLNGAVLSDGQYKYS